MIPILKYHPIIGPVYHVIYRQQKANYSKLHAQRLQFVSDLMTSPMERN